MVSQTINRLKFSVQLHILHFCLATFLNASLRLMALISFERYLAICHPIKHLTMKGMKRNIRLLSAVWLSAMIVSIPYALKQSTFTTYCVMWPKRWQGMPKTFNGCKNKKVGCITDYFKPSFTLSQFTLVQLINSFLFFRIIRKLGKRSVAETDTSYRF